MGRAAISTPLGNGSQVRSLLELGYDPLFPKNCCGVSLRQFAVGLIAGCQDVLKQIAEHGILRAAHNSELDQKTLSSIFRWLLGPILIVCLRQRGVEACDCANAALPSQKVFPAFRRADSCSTDESNACHNHAASQLYLLLDEMVLGVATIVISGRRHYIGFYKQVRTSATKILTRS